MMCNHRSKSQNVLVIAKLKGQKLPDTLRPLTACPCVKQIYLVRRYPLEMPKVVCYAPPRWIRWSRLLSEGYRLGTIMVLCCVKPIDWIVGIHWILHGIYAALAGTLARIPVLLMIIESPEKYRRNPFFGWCARRATWVTVRGRRSRQFMIDVHGVVPSRMMILRDVFEPDHALNPQTERPYDLLFVGYFTPAKRIDILLKVVARLKKNGRSVRVGLIGQGPLHDVIADQRRQLGLEKEVTLLGFVPSVELYFGQSKIFIMTSQTEGLPTALLEAMRWGIPSVVPDVGDISDVAIDGENALVVPALDVIAFARAVERLLGDDHLYGRLARQASTRWAALREGYTLEQIQQCWQQMLTPETQH